MALKEPYRTHMRRRLFGENHKSITEAWISFNKDTVFLNVKNADGTVKARTISDEKRQEFGKYNLLDR